MKRAVIVVAGGSGKRMGAEIPKQFISIGGKPILMHTLNNLYAFDREMIIVLVMHEGSVGLWRELCGQYKFNVPHILAFGGKERFDSVKNGLDAIYSEVGEGVDVVAVHDGVRPFVNAALLGSLFDSTANGVPAIPVLPMVDSIREYRDEEKSIAVDRKKYCRVQTPQCFPFKKLFDAYKAVSYSAEITDDASVWEHCFPDEPVALVKGDERNLKITTAIDLVVAEYVVQEF